MHSLGTSEFVTGQLAVREFLSEQVGRAAPWEVLRNCRTCSGKDRGSDKGWGQHRAAGLGRDWPLGGARGGPEHRGTSEGPSTGAGRAVWRPWKPPSLPEREVRQEVREGFSAAPKASPASQESPPCQNRGCCGGRSSEGPLPGPRRPHRFCLSLYPAPLTQTFGVITQTFGVAPFKMRKLGAEGLSATTEVTSCCSAWHVAQDLASTVPWHGYPLTEEITGLRVEVLCSPSRSCWSVWL